MAAPAGRGRGKATPTTLVVTEGPLVGTSLPLRGAGILIGRNPECTLDGSWAKVLSEPDTGWSTAKNGTQYRIEAWEKKS